MIRVLKKMWHKSNRFGRVNVFHLRRLQCDSKVRKHLQHLHLRRPRRPPRRLLASFHASRRRRCAASVESGPPPRWQPLIFLNVSTSACGGKRHQLEGAGGRGAPQWGRSSSRRWNQNFDWQSISSLLLKSCDHLKCPTKNSEKLWNIEFFNEMKPKVTDQINQKSKFDNIRGDKPNKQHLIKFTARISCVFHNISSVIT